jgi:hypothetical protein
MAKNAARRNAKEGAALLAIIRGDDPPTAQPARADPRDPGVDRISEALALATRTPPNPLNERDRFV